MSATDIINSINKKTDKEIEGLNEENEKELKKLEKGYTEKLEKKKEQLLKEVKQKADKKISQINFQLKFLLTNRLLKNKKAVIDQAYRESLNKLSSLDSDQYQKLLANLLKTLPKLKTGTIAPAKENQDAVKTALSKSNSPYELASKTVDAKGGFVFESGGLTIDNTLESLISSLKEQTETQVAQILFSN